MKYQQIVPNILKNVRSMSVVLGRWQTGSSRGKGPSTLKGTEGRLDLKQRPVPFLRPLPRSHCNNWINLFYLRGLGSKQRRRGEIRKGGRKERNRPKIPLPSLQILEMLSPRAKLFLPQLKFRQRANTGWVYLFENTENELVKSMICPEAVERACCPGWAPEYICSMTSATFLNFTELIILPSQVPFLLIRVEGPRLVNVPS